MFHIWVKRNHFLPARLRVADKDNARHVPSRIFVSLGQLGLIRVDYSCTACTLMFHIWVISNHFLGLQSRASTHVCQSSTQWRSVNFGVLSRSLPFLVEGN